MEHTDYDVKPQDLVCNPYLLLFDVAVEPLFWDTHEETDFVGVEFFPFLLNPVCWNSLHQGVGNFDRFCQVLLAKPVSTLTCGGWHISCSY